MFCPNCHKEMEDRSYWYYGLADWDMDYPATKHEEYVCSKCSIHYVNGFWEIPEKYAPTEKQIVAVNNICLDRSYEKPAPTKNSYWKFINSYIKLKNTYK